MQTESIPFPLYYALVIAGIASCTFGCAVVSVDGGGGHGNPLERGAEAPSIAPAAGPGTSLSGLPEAGQAIRVRLEDIEAVFSVPTTSEFNETYKELLLSEGYIPLQVAISNKTSDVLDIKRKDVVLYADRLYIPLDNKELIKAGLNYFSLSSTIYTPSLIDRILISPGETDRMYVVYNVKGNFDALEKGAFKVLTVRLRQGDTEQYTFSADFMPMVQELTQ